MKTYLSVTKTTLLFTFIFACSALFSDQSEQDDGSDNFDADAEKFYEKGAALRLEELRRIAQYENLPTIDGRFLRYLDVLCALPPRKEHYSFIIELLKKKDPHLQEAGVKLATASVSKLYDYTGLEEPLCNILGQSDLEPWVLDAICWFACATQGHDSPPLTKFYREFAAVAYERSPQKKAPEPRRSAFLRSAGIQPYEDARKWVIQVMAGSEKPTPRSIAVLPYLERAFKTKGWAETHKAADKKVLYPEKTGK